MMVVFNEDHTIERLQLIPLAKHGDTDEVFTETIFDFPFEDEWFVFWGGTNVLVNYQDRKSTRLNSSHVAISYAVFCLKKKKTIKESMQQWTRGAMDCL